MIYKFYNLNCMKAKLPKKQQQPAKVQQEEQEQEEQEIEEISLEDINLRPRMVKKDSLFTTFSGTIESGVFDDYKALTLYFAFVAGPDWKRMNGQRTGMTQVASCDDEKIVWNFPFQITYETTYLAGWPQIIVILYGTDFFGKNYVKGYGNIHLPTSGGVQKRRMRIFCPEPRSIISGILGYFQGCIAEYRDVQRVLAYGDGRQVTRTKSIGYIDIKVETSKFNFNKFGYE